MNETKEFLSKFYDEKIKNVEDAPAVMTDTKEDWIESLSTGELVDGNFIYIDTMSVLTDSNGSCAVNMLIINENLEYHSQNLTLRFDRDKAELCRFQKNVILWDEFDEEYDEMYDLDANVTLTKNMEKSAIKQLKEALSKQFKDEMFKDHLSLSQKTDVQKFMQMSIDFYDLDQETFSYEEYKPFIEKFKLDNEVDEVDNDYENVKEYSLKPNVLVELHRTKELFKDEVQAEKKFEDIKNSLRGIVIDYITNKGRERFVEVKGDYSSEEGELYLEIDGEEFRHEYLTRKEDSSCYEDAPSSWTWAAWLLSEESPLVDTEFQLAYQKIQLLTAIEQFVHTLDESTFFYDLDRILES